VTCSLGELDSSSIGTNTTATVTIVVIPSTPGSLVNTATVSGAQADPVTSDNTATATTAVSSPPTGQTVALAPLLDTGPASEVTPTTATLSAVVNPAGQSTAYTWQLGTSTAYGVTLSGATLTGATGQGVVISVGLLTPGTTYDYRIAAANATGAAQGQNVQFTTPRFAPTGLTLIAKQKGGGFAVSGRLTATPSLTAAAACHGTVTVTLRHGRRAVTRRTSITRRCTYALSLSRASPGASTLTASFAGNAVLTGRARTITAVFRPRP
jgi:hypothetical protein